MKNVIVFLRPNCYFKTKEALNEKDFLLRIQKRFLVEVENMLALLQAKATMRLMTRYIQELL